MSHPAVPISIRVDPASRDKAQRLVVRLADRPEFFVRRASLSGVLRLAIVVGLRQLELETAANEAPPRG